MPVLREDELSLERQGSSQVLRHSRSPFTSSETFQPAPESSPELMTATGNIPVPRGALSEGDDLLGPLLPSVTSCQLSTAELSCHTHTAIAYMQKIKRKLPLHGMNQIPSIYKQQPNRQTVACSSQQAAPEQRCVHTFQSPRLPLQKESDRQIWCNPFITFSYV